MLTTSSCPQESDCPFWVRRTKSAPGAKIYKRSPLIQSPNQSDTMSAVMEFDVSSKDEPPLIPCRTSSPTRSTASCRTPPLQTSRTFDSHSNYMRDSPRSPSSVKRKPVPRFLYPENIDCESTSSIGDASCSPPPCGTAVVHAHMLSAPSQLFANTINLRAAPKDITLLPIGISHSLKNQTVNSTARRRKRSTSEYVYRSRAHRHDEDRLVINSRRRFFRTLNIQSS